MTRQQELNDIMDFGHVIQVHADGTIAEPAGVHAPDLYMATADDDAHSILDEHERDYIAQAGRQGWTLLSGWTGQYGYHGVCMHSSEYIGGALERHIRETPGLWVAITVDTDDDDGPDSWALAYREGA